MNHIEELRKKRFQFMNKLYELSEGDQYNVLNGYEIGDELGFEKKESDTICQYLEGEGLIKDLQEIGELTITITHFGVCEVEKALFSPEKPTEYFPPTINIINVHKMENSLIQQNTSHSTQQATFSLQNIQDISEFVKLLERKITQLNVSVDELSEIQADIATLKAHVNSKKPKFNVIKESLLSIKKILEGATGSIVASEFLRNLTTIIAYFK